jgi:ATP-dependent RNA helicase RhlE
MVVATPGRLEDYMRRKIVDLRSVRILVMDEVDRMLDMGFLPAITRILAALPKERQTLCFSATLERSVQGLVQQNTRAAVRISIGNVLKPAETVQLQAFEVPLMHKGNVLRELLYNESGKTLIFARTKRGTERLAKDLMRDGFNTAMIHGDRTQSQRSAAMASFEAGRTQVLVATDVAARGLHMSDVAHVVNYDLPAIAEDFIHRVGRTGRAGLSGLATSIVSGAEMIELRRFERTLKLRIERKELGKMQPSEQRKMPIPITLARKNTNTLKSRTLNSLPGEIFA